VAVLQSLQWQTFAVPEKAHVAVRPSRCASVFAVKCMSLSLSLILLSLVIEHTFPTDYET
jgi:hypothetical protein